MCHTEPKSDQDQTPIDCENQERFTPEFVRYVHLQAFDIIEDQDLNYIDVEDIAQETLLKLWSSNSNRGISCWKTFACRVIRRTVGHTLRFQSAQKRAGEVLSLTPEQDESARGECDQSITPDNLQNAWEHYESSNNNDLALEMASLWKIFSKEDRRFLCWLSAVNLSDIAHFTESSKTYRHRAQLREQFLELGLDRYLNVPLAPVSGFKQTAGKVYSTAC
jgi:DNA-directed RNA polymerase specialized sigma24 family protein